MTRRRTSARLSTSTSTLSIRLTFGWTSFCSPARTTLVRSLTLHLCARCQLTHFPRTANQLTIDDQVTPSFVKAVSLGRLAPSASLRKTFQLSCIGSAGDRQLDLSIRSQLVTSQSSDEPLATSSPSTEILRTLTIPAVQPLHCAFDTHFHERRRPVKRLLDLSEPDGWEGASDVSVVVKVHAAGPWDVEVSGMCVVCEVSTFLTKGGCRRD
jgi:hypothetical protein